MDLRAKVELLLGRVGAPQRRYPRQEAEWELIEVILGRRLPTDFKMLSDRCPHLWIGGLEIHIPRFEQVSFPAGIPPRLNLRSWLDEEITYANSLRAPLEGEVFSEKTLRSQLTRVGRLSLQNQDTGAQEEFLMTADKAELIPWGIHYESGTMGYWHAVGEDPDSWPVVVAYTGALWRWECSLVDYLLGALDATVTPDWLVAPVDEVDPSVLT